MCVGLFNHMNRWETWAGFWAVIGIFVLIGLFVGLLLYLVKAFGLYRIAQRKGIEHAWLAWIPFAQEFLYAETIGWEIKVGNFKVPQFPWVYIAVNYGAGLIAAFLNVIPFFGQILSMLLGPAIYVADIYVMYRFFKLFEGENAVVYTVICAIFPVAFPFFVLAQREKPFAAETV